MLLAIVAWYGLAVIGGQWVLVGPYAEREACTMVTTDVDAILLQIGERP